jgi:general nucleoside transport system permease protein
MTGVLTAGIIATAPIMLAALGGLVSERAGVMAIGLEGYMIAGAFAGLWGAHRFGTVAGVGAAAAAGLVLGGLVAWLCVRLRASQVVVGLAMILLATGAAGYANFAIYNGEIVTVKGFPDIAIPGLSEIPTIGPALFDQPLFWYFAVLVGVVLILYFRYTTSGLALHATGENPFAAQARGIPVIKVRCVAVVAGCVLASLAGAIFTIGQGLQFTPTVSSGRGFIALAAIYLGGWRVGPLMAACLLFGLADVAQLWANILGVGISTSVLSTAPYVLTLVALAALRRRGNMPGGLGVPFASEQRVVAQ